MTRLTASLCVTVLLTALPAAAAAQAPAAPDRLPPQGGPGVYREVQQLARTLEAAAKTAPALATSPILITDRYSIQEVRRGAAGPPAVHQGWSELHYILDGGGVLVTGGRIAPGANGQPAAIEGGLARAVHKGDAIVVPPDTPHQYRSVEGSLTYLEVRFPDPVLAARAKP